MFLGTRTLIIFARKVEFQLQTSVHVTGESSIGSRARVRATKEAPRAPLSFSNDTIREGLLAATTQIPPMTCGSISTLVRFPQTVRSYTSACATNGRQRFFRRRQKIRIARERDGTRHTPTCTFNPPSDYLPATSKSLSMEHQKKPRVCRESSPNSIHGTGARPVKCPDHSPRTSPEAHMVCKDRLRLFQQRRFPRESRLRSLPGQCCG
jgi:hypothetical protein